MSEWARFQTAFETRLKQDEKRFRRRRSVWLGWRGLVSLSSNDAKSALVRVPWVHGSLVRLRRDEGDGLCSGLVGLCY